VTDAIPANSCKPSYEELASLALEQKTEIILLRKEIELWKQEAATSKRDAEAWKNEAERLDQVVERLKSAHDKDQEKEDTRNTPREHVDSDQIQLAFLQLAPELLHLVPKPEPLAQCPAGPEQQPSGKSDKPPKKVTPHGRNLLPENLPVDSIIIQPKNLPANAQVIGEDVSWRLGFRRASFYRLKVVRPRYQVPCEVAGTLDQDEVHLIARQSVSFMHTTETSPEASVVSPGTEPIVAAQSTKPSPCTTVEQEVVTPIVNPEVSFSDTDCAAPTNQVSASQAVTKPAEVSLGTTVVQSAAPVEIIQRGLPTVDLLAAVMTAKFADKLPFNRQHGMYGRASVSIATNVMCGWTETVSDKVTPLIRAMELDCRNADIIHTDSTGILVQDKPRCKNGAFWVYVSNNGHIIFRYCANNSGDDPKKFFANYRGIVIADATATLDAILKTQDGPSDRAGCWSHARRYFYKAIDTNRLALIGIGLINRLFELDREWAKLPASERLRSRQQQSAPLFKELVDWAQTQLQTIGKDRDPFYKALYYLTNNQQELSCFLRDGKVPLTNNISERQLRSLVFGRANWLFVGGDHTGPWTANISSLVGSCTLHNLDPQAYLRDLFRVLPHWPRERVLELCPRDWLNTRSRINADELTLPFGPLTIPTAAG
jgi:transposase